MFELLAQLIARITLFLSALSGPVEQVSELPTGVIWFDYKPVPEVVEERKSNSVTATAVDYGTGVEYWRELVNEYFPDPHVALAIMKCESRGNASAHNWNPNTGDDSVGLFQINLHANLLPDRINILKSLGYEVYDRETAVNTLKDPVANIQMARYMSGNGSDWSAWSCSK